MNAPKGILLVNLGSPDSPSTPDVRKYLREFLLDGRVIDIPTLPRQLLVRGIIAPFRAPKSAKTYREVWSEDGSPLITISRAQTREVQALLGPEYKVVLAMRYQSPNIESALRELEQANVKSIRVVPLFPQYASATTGSLFQEVMRILSTWQLIPQVEFLNSYPTLPAMIETFADNARALNYAEYDHLLFSFHGLPQRQLIKADRYNHCLQSPDCCEQLSSINQFCYSAQCYATGHAIARELGLDKQQYTISFQSRLGKTPWLQPYTTQLLEEMPAKGIKKLLVFSPAFVADCLETIYEIATEYLELFQHHGGEVLTLVPSLNTEAKWIQALASLCREDISNFAFDRQAATA